MGYGDEIMVSAQARALRRRDPRPVRVLDRFGRERWHEMWLHNDDFAPVGVAGNWQELHNGPSLRPYIVTHDKRRFVWCPWDIEPGRIVLNAQEQALAKRYAGRIIIEPYISGKASPNKDWGYRRWQVLAALAQRAGIRFTQLGAPGTVRLPRADFIPTHSMRDACAILSTARAAVLPEGGLHHAAAAFGVPAVVIFGGYISPDITGYTLHRNLFTGGAACGSRTPCSHCAGAMAKIEPAMVMEALTEIMEPTYAT